MRLEGAPERATLSVRTPSPLLEAHHLLGDGFDDVSDLGLERRTANQEAVNVGARRQLRGVLRIGRPAILDTDLIRRLLIHLLGNPVADCLVGLLCLLGRRRHAGANRPDRLVCDHDARLVLKALQDRDDVLELRHALGQHCINTLLADRQGLADAEDAHETLLKDVCQLGRHQLVALLRRRQAELTAALRVTNQAALHLSKRSYTQM